LLGNNSSDKSNFENYYPSPSPFAKLVLGQPSEDKSFNTIYNDDSSAELEIIYDNQHSDAKPSALKSSKSKLRKPF
jgi:hypothetical protein